MAGASKSPEEFAKQRRAQPKAHPKCATCRLPEIEDLNRAYKAGVTLPELEEWLLEDRGYTKDQINSSLMQNHFTKFRHHE